jgi:pimeloyl-ACP methyl ester carboxylesterase
VIRWASLFVLTVICGCHPGVDDLFFVRQQDADLPVWLQGDLNGDSFILMQHGSGASGKVYDWLFDDLEEEHTLVYWDQRGAGISQGDAAAEGLTLESSVEDLRAVLEALKARHRPKRLVLMGHSLGGGLSQAFLRDPERAEGIAAYIDLCGGRNLAEAYGETRARMIDEGERLKAQAAGEKAAHWHGMLEFYETRPDFPRGEPDRSRHAAYVDDVLMDLGFDSVASREEMSSFLVEKGAEDTLFGTFDAFVYGQNTARFLSTFHLDGVAMTPEDVSSISVPALVLAAEFDFAIPVGVTERTYAAFAEGRSPGRHVVLQDAGHFPMWDRPGLFFEAIEDFLGALPPK